MWVCTSEYRLAFIFLFFNFFSYVYIVLTIFSVTCTPENIWCQRKKKKFNFQLLDRPFFFSIPIFLSFFSLHINAYCCILMTMNNFLSSIISILLKIVSAGKLMFYVPHFFLCWSSFCFLLPRSLFATCICRCRHRQCRYSLVFIFLHYFFLSPCSA